MIAFLQQWGVWGLFLGSFLAATVVPFSSDILYVGVLAAGAPVWQCFLSATVGNWLGGLTSYAIGWIGRWEWIERGFHVKHETLVKQKARIDKWGPLAALLTWVPFIGDVIAIALGFYKLSPWKCALFMLVGKAARYAVWTLIFI